MKMYRIITENKNRDWIEKQVGYSFDGFSVIEQTGYWKGKRESSLCIEIVTDVTIRPIQYICQQICQHNEQESVLLQELDCNVWFIRNHHAR